MRAAIVASPPAAGGNDVLTRTVSGAVLAAVVLAGTWMGGLAAGFVFALAAAIVRLEWGKVTGETAAIALTFALVVAASVSLAASGLVLYGLGAAALGLFAATLPYGRIWRPAGVAYAVLLGLPLMALRLAPLGLEAVVFVFVVTWATDIGAFFAGRAFGGAKLWPSVSPNKTWAGANGGLLAAMIAGLAFALLASIPLSVPLLLVTIALSLACQAGDLFESWIKRRFGVKDSSRLIPGHGGLMDRVDGLIFVGTLAAVIGLLHGGADDLARGLLLW